MKRAILILLSVFVILLASCGGSITPGEYNYSAATYTIDEDSRYISIAYPVLTGTDYDDAANELLLSESLEQMENYLTYSAGANDGRFYRYTIDSVSSQCLGQELASFLCIGSYSDEYSDYPETIAYSFNLNPKTGELYAFDELILDFSIIKEKFESGAFDYISGLENLLTLTNYSDMIVGYGDTYQLYPPIYFIADENDFELALSVGLVYELGGHAEFSIDADLVSSALTEQLLGMLK
ncbi:MAG TPA: hypothetical protein H9681_08005 [Firmicutes bacterium]|nr:hypothetical protein [Bacillota bacterium]